MLVYKVYPKFWNFLIGNGVSRSGYSSFVKNYILSISIMLVGVMISSKLKSVRPKILKFRCKGYLQRKILSVVLLVATNLLTLIIVNVYR
jgi:hypothetical protein